MALTRSENMSRIRGKSTSPEVLLRRALWAKGKRYRLHHRTSAGRPDLVFLGVKLAVFIDGCFWHGCPEHYVRPKSKTEFWSGRLRENVERDRRQTLALESEGWTVCRIWEHEIHEDLDQCVARVIALLDQEAVEPVSDWRVIQADPIEGTGKRERWTLQRLRDASQQRVIERERTTHKGKKKSA